MWQNQELVWEDTDHVWNAFGEPTSIDADNGLMYAKVLATWKKISLDVFIKRVLEAALSIYGFIEEPNVATSFALFVTAKNLFPLDLKYVKDDKLASKFLELIYETDDGEEYFLQDEIQQSKEIHQLIDYFIEQKLLIEQNGKLIIQGKILNKAHIAQA